MVIKEVKNEDINEKLLYTETQNGLKIYFMPKKGYIKKHAMFSTDYGSIDNKFIPIGEDKPLEVPEGIAHFLEHKLFEEPEVNIFEKFSDIGGSVNAFTSFNQTSYLFETIDNFYENLELLIKFVQSPYLTDKNVEKEKGIISQEIRMYEDDPGWKVYFNLLEAMYSSNPVRIDIAGTIDSITNINKELLYKAYNTFYHPSNMILFVVGDLDFKEIIKVVEKSEKKTKNKISNIERIKSLEIEEINKSIVEYKMYTSNPIFHIGFKDKDIGKLGKSKVEKDLKTDIILDMLFGNSSKFYNEFYEKGLIDSSFGANYTGKQSYGHSLIFGESNNPKLVYDNIIDLIEENPEDILKEKDFERIKHKYLGEFLLSFNSISSISQMFTDFYFDEFLLTDYIDLIRKVRYTEIIERFKEHFNKDNTVLSIVNPL